MQKIYLILSTDEKEYKNIDELTSVWEHFDGLGICFHGNKESDAYKLLTSRKKEGFITQVDEYWGQHGHDLNNIILHPKIKVGDILLKLDSAERCNPNFAMNIRPFVKMLSNKGINTVYQRSKCLLFRRFPHQYALHTPHYGISGLMQNMIDVAQTEWFSDDKDYCYSIRSERPQYDWIGHYLRYFLIIDSNHNLLGAHHFGDEQQVFQQKEQFRLEFLLYIQSLGIDNNKDSLINYWKENQLDDRMKYFINNNRILNDSYRHFILNDTENLIDDITVECKIIA